MQVRKCSPFLESVLLSEDKVLSSEWKAIPDIWRSSAEKYGDRVALVDPYHDPPTDMTYKQVGFLSYMASLYTLLFLHQGITFIMYKRFLALLFPKKVKSITNSFEECEY